MLQPSLKKQVVLSFAVASNTDMLKGNGLILLTSSAIITGELLNEPAESDSNSIGAVRGILMAASQQFDKTTEGSNETPLTPNDGFITLKNATIRGLGGHSFFNLETFVVFYDQIVGVSMGNFPDQK